MLTPTIQCRLPSLWPPCSRFSVWANTCEVPGTADAWTRKQCFYGSQRLHEWFGSFKELGWITVKICERWARIFLAVSFEGLDSAIAAKFARGCLRRFRPNYSALYSFKAFFKGIPCEPYSCLCKGKNYKFQQLSQWIGVLNLFLNVSLLWLSHI